MEKKESRRALRLVEVTEPNLFEDMFPHTEIPRVVFDQKVVEEIDGKTVTVDFSSIKNARL